MGDVIGFNLIIQKKNHRGDKVMCTILKKLRDKTPYDLLKEYEISSTPPIDISKLMDNMGISTIAKDFTEIEKDTGVQIGSVLGAAFSNKDNLAIFYKKSDSLHRKKFTIAHELAHCCLHCPTDESSHIEFRLEPFAINLPEEELEKERQANIFAGQLLIPKDALLKHYEQMLIPSLTELAMIFDVSTSVMAARLDYLKMPYYKDSVTEIIL